VTFAALVEAGYLILGMDPFARPGDGLAQALLDGTLTRNFQGYSTGGETDLVAFGVSAISKVADGYAQNGKALAAYAEAIGAGRFATCRGLLLSQEDRLRREVIQQIMCRIRVEKTPVEEAFAGLPAPRFDGGTYSERSSEGNAFRVSSELATTVTGQ
jgi:oxygen-independent coproporphyrinogen-3 oxidase